MTKLVLWEYEIIGLFAPFSEALPAHNMANAAPLTNEKVKAFKYLMQNPRLSAELKILVGERFEDLGSIHSVEWRPNPQDILKDNLERINFKLSRLRELECQP